MKIFLNEAESPFARCFIEVAHDKGHSVIAARQQQASEEAKELLHTNPNTPQTLSWNLASVFSIRLALRQCHFIWQDQQPANYVFLLQSNMASASLFRDKLHEVQQKIEQQFYGRLVFLRELESYRAKLAKSTEAGQQSSKLILVILEENSPMELLGGSIYAALCHSLQHLLSNSSDPNTYGFYTKSNNHESYSHFILDQVATDTNKHVGKWQNFKESWLSAGFFKDLRRK